MKDVERPASESALHELRGSGLTILVATPYMDEASRCDRVALMQRGRVLAIDEPAGLGRLFEKPLLSVTGPARYPMLQALRRFPHAHSVLPFGDELHYADARALDQILYNLIDNAIKYSPEGGELLVRALRERGKLPEGRASVLIEVCDQGAGLTPEQRTRIFERFYRVDDGRSRDQGGTGLGLAIVKHLAQAMEGRVGVRANAPRGSIFWVRLPAASPRDATAIDLATTLEEIA